MSRTEDYLDELLNSVSDVGKKEETGSMRKTTPEDDFLSAFEDEILSGEDSDDFLQEFERELNLGKADFSDSKQSENRMDSIDTISDMDSVDTIGDMDSINVMSDMDSVNTIGDMDSINMMSDTDTVNTIGDMDSIDTLGGMNAFGSMEQLGEAENHEASPLNLDEILSNAKEKMQDAGTPGGSPAEDNIMVDTMGDFSGGSIGNDIPTFPEGGLGLGAGSDEKEAMSDMLELPEEFALDEFDVDPLMEQSMEASAPEPEEEDGAKKKKRKKEKKKRKNGKDSEDGKQEGFLKKFSRVLFGEDGADEAAGGEKALSGETGASDAMASSSENIDLLMELQGSAGAPAGEPEKNDKKKKKKEKKAKEKKAKEKEPKKAKPKKEKPKKEKKPKEPDLTPPLPKAPVILIFVMAASFMVLVIMGTNLIGYSNPMSEAKKAYGLGNYEEAYQAVGGLEIKEADQFIYEKYRLMANVASEYSSYQSFMEAGIYDMALDSLIRAVGRCAKYREDAENYDCLSELDKLEAQSVSALSSFGITEERALELYQSGDKEVYTIEVHNILLSAGLATEG